MLREEEIGKRIRKLRLERKLTQSALAQASGLTKGYVSKIENSKSSPPVSTLIVLAEALGVTMDTIFSEEGPRPPFTVVRKTERMPVARPGSQFGYFYEPLGHKFPERHMDPYILTIPRNPAGTKFFQHPGEEILMVLEGVLRFTVGQEEIVMHPGDCIYFDSGIPHSAFCEGKNQVKCFIVIYSGELKPPHSD